jgi:putative molybdopterin biosynthesis protein
LTSRSIGEAIGRGFTLAEIEAAFVAQRARWQAQHDRAQLRTPSEARVLGLGSHDLCLELLLTQFAEVHAQPRLSFTAVGSLAGLMALARGEAHFAAAHLYDAEADDYNVPFVRRLMAGQPCALITLAQRVQGFIVAQGNPKKIQGVRDLARRGVHYVNRQRGSGTRVLLDELLHKARIAQRSVQGYAREEQTHPAVAAAVASGTADVGLGIQAAARSFGLDFVPLVQERFELILPRNAPEIELFLSVIKRPEFKQVAESLGGYDLTELGRVRYT